MTYYVNYRHSRLGWIAAGPEFNSLDECQEYRNSICHDIERTRIMRRCNEVIRPVFIRIPQPA